MSSENNHDQHHKHGVPADGMMCLCTMEDITLEDGNYVEYQSYPSGVWLPCLYERCVVEKLLKEQFDNFLNRVKTTDCQSELKRLLSKGPPIYVSDDHAMPLYDKVNDTHIQLLWFSNDPQNYKSSTLTNAVMGIERQELWNELNKFLIISNDDDDDDDES